MKNYLEILRSIKLNFEFNTEHGILNNAAVIAVGKSSAFMYRKFIEKYPETINFPKIIILPQNSDPMGLSNVVFSTHPEMSELSFKAGNQLLEFIESSQANTFIVLISGGSSALFEFSSNHKFSIDSNHSLLSSGKDIVEINRIRTESSLIKGGKLALMFPEKHFNVFSMSDIPFFGGEKLVGSMPFYSEITPNSTLIKCADCITLKDHLSLCFQLCEKETIYIDRFTDSVEELSGIVIDHLKNCKKNLFICGEPTLKVDGTGKGGRMLHLALLTLPYLDDSVEFYALSSDGIDGNSEYAGAAITDLKRKYTINEIRPFIETFDSATFLEKEDFTRKTGYTGINLNDFVLIRKKPEGQV
jgi:glycerate 2-kinase